MWDRVIVVQESRVQRFPFNDFQQTTQIISKRNNILKYQTNNDNALVLVSKSPGIDTNITSLRQ
jgi:hypothetical protein